ncbi:MAG: hypothetical protein QNJ41_24025 [Xenococcaceae cyanobacterium MO_188.B32]|nr:hypothetical protein [Xenococcaceae cyanobacterium MO_188.B32]
MANGYLRACYLLLATHRSLIFKWSWLINESNKRLYKAFSRLTGDRETILGDRYDHEAIRT